MSTHDRDLRPATPQLDLDSQVAPGRGTLTSRLVPPARQTIVLRVESAEAAAAVADRFGPRDGNGVSAGADTAVQRAASSSGAPLPSDVRGQFESSTGADLSGVRVHTGGESAEAAAAVGAHAYTTGQDIHFGAGKYAPADPFGLHLLAHEVAHTVQQAGGAASGRQNKLEVSTPGDSAEVEADRAADAMVSGAPASIGGSSGVNRQAIFRDGPPPADAGAKKDPAAAGAPGAGAGDQVNLDWWVNWENKETGQTVQPKSNARTGKDAAAGTLKVIPDGDKAKPGVMKWTNAASSGAVEVGKVPQDKNKGGQVSSDIQWGKPPSVSAKVTVQETAQDPGKAGQSQLKAKQADASQAASDKLSTDLQTMGDLGAIQADVQQAASSKVGPGGNGYSYTVAVAVTPGAMDAANSRAVGPVQYSGASADEKRTAMIAVDTQIQKLKGTASVENSSGNSSASSSASSSEHKDEHKDSHTDDHSDEHSDSVTVQTEFKDKVVKQFSAAFDSAFEDMRKKATTNSGSISGKFNGGLSGDVKAGGGIKDFKVDLGAVLAAILIEDPPLAFAVKKALGTATLNGNLDVEMGGDLRVKLDGTKQWKDEDIQNTLEKNKTKLSGAFTSETSTQVTTQVTAANKSQNNAANKDSNVDANKDSKVDKKADAHEDKHRSSSSTETVGVKYVIGEPKLTVS